MPVEPVTNIRYDPDLQVIPALAPAPSSFFFPITPVLNNNTHHSTYLVVTWKINGPTCYHFVTAWTRTALWHHLEKLGHNLETSLKQIWTIFRITLRHLWDIFGTYLGHLWDILWRCLGHLWDIFGTQFMDMFVTSLRHILWTSFGHVDFLNK